MEFEWDKSKAAANLKKPITVFGNSLAVIFDDEAHSIDEQGENHYWSLSTKSLAVDFLH